MSLTRENTGPRLGLSLLGAATVIFRVIGANPSIVLVWILFSLVMELVRSFAILFMAAKSQVQFDAMDTWSPLTNVTGAGLPAVARLMLPLLMLVSIAFFQATLNRAVMASSHRPVGLAALCTQELKRFASISLVYAAIVSAALIGGPLMQLGWAVAKAPSMDGISEMVGTVISFVLLAKLSLVSPAAYDTDRLGFVDSWQLTKRHGRMIFLLLVICGLIATVQTLLVSAAHYQFLALLNGGRPISPVHAELGSLGAFALSAGLRWDLLQSVLNTLFWPIILAPLPVVYLRLAGRAEAKLGAPLSNNSPPRDTAQKPRGRSAIGLPITLGLVALAIGSLAYGWWAQNGKDISQSFACNDFNQPEKAARAIAACNAALRSSDLANDKDGTFDKARAGTLRFRGEDYRDLGDLPHALADLLQSDKLEPKEFHTLQDLGDVHEAIGDYGAAASDYQRLFAVLPSDVYAYTLRCSERAEQGKVLDQARADCDAVLKFKPGDANARDGRGILGLRQSRFGEAWADFNAAMRAEPDDAGHRYGRGLAAIGLGHVVDGQADLAAAAKINAEIASTFAGYGLNSATIRK